MADNATVSIPNDILEPVIRAQVAAGITAQLGNPEVLIQKIVSNAMSQKVNSEGKVSRESYSNRHDLIELLAGRAIRAIVDDVLTSWIDAQRPAIEKKVRDSLARKQGMFAKAMVDGLSSSLQSRWGMKCDVHFETPGSDR